MPEEQDSTTERIRIRLRQSVENHGAVFAKFFDPVIHLLEMLPGEPRRVGRKTRVLVVEDELPLLRAYARVLGAQEDLEVIAVARMEDALVAVENYDTIDVLILDILLPDGSGIDVAAHVLQKFPAVNAAVISVAMSEKIRGKILSMVGVENRRRWSFYGKPSDDVMDVILKASGTKRM